MCSSILVQDLAHLLRSDTCWRKHALPLPAGAGREHWLLPGGSDLGRRWFLELHIINARQPGPQELWQQIPSVQGLSQIL